MKSNKLTASIVIIGLAVMMVLTLWQNPTLLITGILIVACCKHVYLPIKKELLMYIVSAVVGAGGESLIMLTGPWSYASTQIFNFPVWLPFLWGLAGITGITLYESLIEEDRVAKKRIRR